MNTQNQTQFVYGDQPIHFDLLDECSISRHLQANSSFYELPFLEALGRALPHETVAFDVGAHIGNHTIYFARVLGWKVVAFEPNPEAFEKLVANVRANGVEDRVTCFQVALSDRDEDVTLSRTERSDAGTLSITGVDGPGETIKARASTLDSQLPLVEGPPILLKIDVEGHELEVLRGGATFLERLQPHVTTEVQTAIEFDNLAEVLGASHQPIGVFNPTPTVLWKPRTDTEDVDPDLSLIRYAIEGRISYNESHRRNLQGRRSLVAVESALKETENETSTSRPRGLIGLRNQLSASLDLHRLTGKRLLVISVGENDVPGSALSTVAGPVDSVEISTDDPRTVSMQRFVNAENVGELTFEASHASERLTAAKISMFIEEGDQEYGSVEAAAVIGGESAPEIADLTVDLLDVPYFHLALEPTYLPRRLPATIGAALRFISHEDQLEEWTNRQITPAEVLGPSDAMSMLGAFVRTLQSRSTGRRRRPESDHRLLLVSYYAPPVKTVATQRLSYWKDHLTDIAEDMGLSLSVDWLTATSPKTTETGYLHVPDRGWYDLPEEDWDRLKSLEDLGLDTVAATWSHYVREFIPQIEESYDAVVISGNPFYYFELATSFKDAWDCHVALDFRDPWARQERFKYSTEQRAALIELEELLVDQADSVLSVNRECLDVIAPNTETPKHIVANGFDDSVVDSVSEPSRPTGPGQRKTRLAYAGTVYATLPLDNLLAALPPTTHSLVHLGRDYSKSQAAKDHPTAFTAGVVDYRTLISELKSSDAGIVMTTGEPTMSTTKIFDYVACELDIIIVTRGRPFTGLLHEMTSDLDGIHWVRDDVEELTQFFRSFRPQRRSRAQRLRFSRREQARQLLRVLYREQADALERMETR